MRRLQFCLFFVFSLTVFTLAGCNTTPAATPTPTPRTDFKIGLILNAQGPLRDGTFSGSTYNGVQLAGRDFGLQYAYRETVEDKDYPTVIEKMIAEGHNIIVTVGFQMQTDTINAARSNPKVYFIGVDQGADDSPANYAGVQFAEDQGGFLAGALASMMTKTNVVGVVGGPAFPAVQRFVNGFINGARYVNPQVNALSVNATAFDDVQQGRDLANGFIAQGADVIFGAGGLTGSSGITLAAEKGVWAIGVDQDEFLTTFTSGLHAEYILTSALKRVDVGVYTVISDILKGEFKGGTRVIDAGGCGITYAPFHKAEAQISDAVKRRLEAIWRALAGGTLVTGADGSAGVATPEGLAAGAAPIVADNAPRLSDCTRN